MFICDLVKGIEHFRTSIDKGIEIIENLRGRLSGLGIPHFIVDSPEGKGKIPILPNYIVKKEDGQTILRNYKNEVVKYPDPIS
jgi:lysine 2,3-aminomutase